MSPSWWLALCPIRISRLRGEQVARLEERLTDLAHHSLTDLALRPLAAQVASTLVKLGDAAWPTRFGQTRTIHLSHAQLAGLLGASREATSKIMGEITAKKAIRQSRGRIIIQDRARRQTKTADVSANKRRTHAHRRLSHCL